MAEYKLTEYGVHKKTGNLYIPNTSSNKDWREYLEWLAKGNTPDPADPEPPEPTTEELANDWLGNPVNRAIIQGIADSTGVAFGQVVAAIQQAARGN